MRLPKKIFFFLLIIEVLVNFSGIAVPFFSNDPALYAAIAKTMAQQNDFTNLYVYGIDWLDKPHFPFWMAAFSFKIFGISEWSYRLPALLFILLGAFYTYRLARKIYNDDVAQIAVLVMLSSQHLIMSNTDVRAEPYLVGLIIAAVFHFYRLFQRFSFVDLLLGSLFAGCAVMTKGIFALVPVGCAIAGHAIFSKQLRHLFRWRWLWAILLTAVFVLPEVYTVYRQFDQHPEKNVFGRTGVSGVRWFLWDSQFSRFVMDGPIKRPKGDVFYYLHTLLWAFAPWCLIFYYVLASKMVQAFKKRKLQEYVTVSAMLPMLLFFSLSKFQLNFYTNILFPFFSILVASFIASFLSKKETKLYSITQAVYSCLFVIGVIVLNILFQPPYQWWYFFGALFLLMCLYVVFKRVDSINLRWLMISILSVLYINLYLNLAVYPTMGALKGEYQAARFVNEFYPDQDLGVFNDTRHGFSFHSHQPVQRFDMDKWMSGSEKDRIFYVDAGAYGSLLSAKARFQIIREFNDYASESISAKFINVATRNQTLQTSYLVRAAP